MDAEVRSSHVGSIARFRADSVFNTSCRLWVWADVAETRMTCGSLNLVSERNHNPGEEIPTSSWPGPTAGTETADGSIASKNTGEKIMEGWGS